MFISYLLQNLFFLHFFLSFSLHYKKSAPSFVLFCPFFFSSSSFSSLPLFNQGREKEWPTIGICRRWSEAAPPLPVLLILQPPLAVAVQHLQVRLAAVEMCTEASEALSQSWKEEAVFPFKICYLSPEILKQLLLLLLLLVAVFKNCMICINPFSPNLHRPFLHKAFPSPHSLFLVDYKICLNNKNCNKNIINKYINYLSARPYQLAALELLLLHIILA